MARTEARVRTLIWTDPDFRALTPNAQWAYLFLLSQTDLSHAGVLPLRPRRWTGYANGMDVPTLAEALLELEQTRFIVTDYETEELLVRTFIRNDEVYRQPNLLRAARKSLTEVVSPTLRAALAVEIGRCIALAEGTAKGLLEAMLEDLGKGSANPSPNPSPNPSANPLGARGVVKTVTTDSPNPDTPQPAPRDAARNPSAEERAVLDHTDATHDEARAVVALVIRERRPDRPPGFMQKLGQDGDLEDFLLRVRAATEATNGCPNHPHELASNCRLCAAERKGRPDQPNRPEGTEQ